MLKVIRNILSADFADYTDLIFCEICEICGSIFCKKFAQFFALIIKENIMSLCASSC